MSSDTISKGKSPFYPGQPVPVELFVGRARQIDQIMRRGVGQVAAGKPISMFVRGEYGIGKSSIATYCQALAEREHGLLAVYASLGGVESLDAVGERVLEGTIRAGGFDPSRVEKIRSLLSKYVAEASLFGVKLKTQEARKDSPDITAGLLKFFEEVLKKLEDSGTKGVFLVLDEINGIANDPKFAHYLKTLVDTNAVARKPVPLLLMLCGVEARRADLIKNHEPVNRVFDLVDIDVMSEAEMHSFFKRAFESVHMSVEADAMRTLTHFSAGIPKIMHLVGDEAFWLARDPAVTLGVALQAVISATEVFGKKYIDDQVYKALRSTDYLSILGRVAENPLSVSFERSKVIDRLSEPERKKFDNFLQKMKSLKVIRSGKSQGEWVFIHPMVAFYIWMRTNEPKDSGG
jgi:hypothetical protein